MSFENVKVIDPPESQKKKKLIKSLVAMPTYFKLKIISSSLKIN